jgi:hypothetical protein
MKTSHDLSIRLLMPLRVSSIDHGLRSPPDLRT